MKSYQLENIDPEDIGDLLVKVENSFNITFADNELSHITTFGELCDHIINKIQLENADDCTTQQAFYKLRQTLITIDSKYNDITPDTSLIDLLPRQKRISTLKQIEKNLGFKLSILRPPYFVSFILGCAFITSLGIMYFNWQIGMALLVFFFVGINLSERLGRELKLRTVKDLVVIMSRENYLNSRKKSDTINKKEIERVLTKWFVEDFDLEPSSLNRDSKIFQ